MWGFFLTFLIPKAADERDNVRFVVAEHFLLSRRSVSAARLHGMGLGALSSAYVNSYTYYSGIITTTTTSGRQKGYHHIFHNN